MLKNISFKNYKAFESGSLNIKPITILLGANNVGKSSLLKLVLMLQQTAKSESNYKSALRLHGDFVSFGECLNLFRNRNENSILTLTLNFQQKDIYDNIYWIYTGLLGELVDLAFFLNKDGVLENETWFMVLKKHSSTKDNYNVRKYRYRHSDNLGFIDDKIFADLIEGLNIFLSTNNDKIESKGQLLEKNRYYVNLEHIKKIKTKKEEYILSYNFIKKFLDIIKEHYIKIEYDFITENNVMIIKCAKLLNNENNIISIDFDDRKSHKYGPIKVFSDLFNLTELDTQNILKSLKKIFVNQNTIFSFCYNTYLEENSSVFAFYLSEIFQVFISASSEEFDNDNINYVSPLRATPKRYYFLDSARTHISVDTFDGDSIAEILKDNTKLKKQVNEWFRRFDIEIEVDYLKDIIHSLLVNQNSLKLDISDVGFGISQVLPVIMQGYLSHNDSITLVEQPEIHLHPKMQADLGDLFIDIVLNKNYSARKRIPKKNFIIETHSEYLLKRIRRRISEGRIPSEMVSLNLITPQSSTQGAIISELQISETGNFEWPKDFYGGELLKDVTEFFKKQ